MSWFSAKYSQLVDQAKEIAAEKSQQAAKKLSLAKQMVKEGTGQIEETSENPIITDNFQKVEVTRELVKSLYKLMKDVNTTGKANIQVGRQFANTIIELGTKFEEDNAEYGSAMKKMGQRFLEIEKAKEDMLASFETGFIQPMETFAKTDIKNAIASKKENYDSIRMAYDAEKTRQKGRADQSQEAAFLDIKEKFEDSEIDTIELLREVNARRDVDTLFCACEVVIAQETMLQKCKEQSQSMQSFVQGLHKLIDAKRKDHESEKESRDAERRRRLKDKEPIPFETKLFGVPLMRILKRENRKGDQVPELIERFLDFIDRKAIQEEGIFRVSGTLSQIERMKNDCERGLPVDVEEADPHLISGLLKMFLRELPDPLLTYDMYKRFMVVKAEGGEDDVSELVALLHELPQANYVLLEKLMKLLAKITQHSSVNKMGPSNLATVFGPNLLRTKDISESSFSDNTTMGKIVRFMIENYTAIFVTNARTLTESNYEWFVEEIPAPIHPANTRSKTTVIVTRHSIVPTSHTHHMTAPIKSNPLMDDDHDNGAVTGKSPKDVPMSSFQGRSGSFSHSETSSNPRSISRSNSMMEPSSGSIASRASIFGQPVTHASPPPPSPSQKSKPVKDDVATRKAHFATDPFA